MSTACRRVVRRACWASLALSLAGCAAPPAPPPEPQQQPSGLEQKLRPYVPSSRPADPITDALPTTPRDAQPFVPLRYAVELWEILLPRDQVAAADDFWKHVDEPATPEHDRLQQNGIRVGSLPASDIEVVHKLVEDRGGKLTTYQGLAAKQVEIEVHDKVPDQVLFYYDRDGDLVGRTWENCRDLIYFSFETTPRNPDRIRLSFTPAVRSLQKRLVYTKVPGKDDYELKEVVDESNYDVTINADLPLDRLLVIAPSNEARLATTVGGIFLTQPSPSQKQDRFLLVIPRAYTRTDR